MIIYFFDMKIKNLKTYNTVKRRFYYDLNKLKDLKIEFKTKSVLVASNELESILDNFFLKWAEYLEVYKASTNTITKISKEK